MRFLHFLIMCVFFIGGSSCSSKTCSDLQSFKDPGEAIRLVKGMEFPFERSHTLLNSEPIVYAIYKSCDQQTGFFIFKERLTGKEFINQNVPLENWLGFTQDAKKFDYYNKKMRGKFPLVLK